MKTNPLALPAPQCILIPVGDIPADHVRQICRVERLREFCVSPSFGENSVMTVKTWPYKGRWKTYPKMENHARIESWVTISTEMLTVHHAVHGTRSIVAPANMVFATDANGVLLHRKSDGMDFHPMTADFFRKDFAKFVRARMAENFKRRAALKKSERQAAKNKSEQARIEKIFQRDLPSVRVTLADSRNAGNCAEGTLAFAEKKLGISRENVIAASHLFSISAPRLLAVANGQTANVERAIRVAWLRETAVSI